MILTAAATGDAPAPSAGITVNSRDGQFNPDTVDQEFRIHDTDGGTASGDEFAPSAGVTVNSQDGQFNLDTGEPELLVPADGCLLEPGETEAHPRR